MASAATAPMAELARAVAYSWPVGYSENSSATTGDRFSSMQMLGSRFTEDRFAIDCVGIHLTPQLSCKGFKEEPSAARRSMAPLGSCSTFVDTYGFYAARRSKARGD